jgi:mannose-1-phosphate guanylyltransferase
MAISSPTTQPSRYALILAGGSGQRFWPLSRDSLPKQLLRIFGGKTLLELTVDRLEGLIPKENILVLTNHQQEKSVRQALPNLPVENILAEPAKRDTAPAIALGAGWVASRDPEATMVILPADHLIQDCDAFHSVLETSVRAAEETASLVTIGIKPTWPCPSYGYVERGEGLSLDGAPPDSVYEVVRFREKPAPDLAQHFLDQGTFTWNAGMFIWTIPAIRKELGTHCPELSGFVTGLCDCDDIAPVIADQFSTLPKLSIDYALMERASRVLNVEATFDWDDVGNWTSVGQYLDQDDHENQTRGDFCQIDSHANLLFSETKQHVALLGANNLIVVQTEDALLIADRDRAEQIKKLHDLLPDHLK